MKRWQWHLQRIIAAAGLPGLLGAAMMVAAVLLQFMLVQPVSADIDRRQAALAELRSQPAIAPQAAPEQQLAGFYGTFPQPQALSQQLRTLHEVTESHQLFMGKVDYKLSDVGGTPLKRYAVSYSLVTDYPSLRVYLAEVLQALPNAALEDIELERFSEGAQMLEARLGLVLYFHEGS